MSNVWQDVLYALRGMRKSPGFTVVALLTLAVGIGANTAMFSVLNAVVLRPLPYRAADELTMLWTEPGARQGEGRSSYADVQRWRARSKSFADMAVFDPVSMTLTGSDATKQISGVRASPNFFAVLGVQPSRGRMFTNEDADQRRRVIVVSDRFWRTQLAASPDAVGMSVAIDGLRSEVIGIMADDLHFLGAGVDVWEPHTLFPDFTARLGERGGRSWFVVARLRASISVQQAQQEMSALARSLGPAPSTLEGRGIGVTPLSLQFVDASSRLALWMLTGAVFCVFLIGVTNIISLSLARSAARGKEFALRMALGAGRGRLFRQLLTESVTLAVLSGLLGVAAAAVSVPAIAALGPKELVTAEGFGLDHRVLSWALSITLLAGIVIGIAPGMLMRRDHVRNALQAGGRGASPARSTRRIYKGLVVAEFALAIVLLVGAGLLTRSLLLIEHVDPGFDPSRVLSVQLSSPSSWDSSRRVDYYQRVLEQVQAIEGVEAAGMIGDLFIGGAGEQIVTIDGGASVRSEPLRIRRDEVSAGLFATLKMPLMRGRAFSTDDGPNAPRVAIVNEALTRELWPGQDALGRRFKLGPANSAAPWFTVVGLVADARRQGLEQRPVAQMFEPLAQNPSRNETLLIRTKSDDPMLMARTIEVAVRRIEKGVPIYGTTTLPDRLALFQAERRFQTTVLAAFSVAALFLAAVGIYGTIHQSISTRTHEIGVRMAVGAERSDIFRLIVGEGLRLSIAGLALGLAGALWLGRVGSSLLFGITATDPLTYLSVSLVLTGVSFAACYFPARRATRVDPLAALRYD